VSSESASLLRVATPVDAPLIAGLVLRSFREHEGIVPPVSALSESTESFTAKLATATCLIAEVEGEPAGCVFFEQKLDPPHVYLGRLAVLPEYRSRGLARALIAAVEAAARDAGYTLVRLETRSSLTRNVQLYERLGYVCYSHRAPRGSGELLIVQMEKRLG
jgi:ribosomal protein S18 acetylase RimI-like enzyme